MPDVENFLPVQTCKWVLHAECYIIIQIFMILEFECEFPTDG